LVTSSGQLRQDNGMSVPGLEDAIDVQGLIDWTPNATDWPNLPVLIDVTVIARKD